MRELLNVIRHNDIESGLRILDFPNLQDLHVVTHYIIGHLEGRHINHVYERVFQAEYATDLGILSLEELLH